MIKRLSRDCRRRSLGCVGILLFSSRNKRDILLVARYRHDHRRAYDCDSSTSFITRPGAIIRLTPIVTCAAILAYRSTAVYIARQTPAVYRSVIIATRHSHR